MSQRKIVVFDRVTADGYYAATDGNLNWAVPDDAIDEAALEGIPGTDTMLFGRRTYDQFESFWPRVANDAPNAPDPRVNRRLCPRAREQQAIPCDEEPRSMSNLRK